MRPGSRRAALRLVGTGVLAWALAAPAAAPPAEIAGTVQGSVAFVDLPPGEDLVRTDAFVYLRGEGLADAAGPDRPAPLLDQVDYTFVPRVLPVLAGERVEFRNSDDELHNIHTYSKGRRRNRNFNEAQRPGSLLHTTFPRPDSLLVLCDIHSHMMAHMLILPNPFWARVGDDGRYAIAGVPPGSYDLVAWHEFYATVVAPVEVRDGEATVADVSFTTAIVDPD